MTTSVLFTTSLVVFILGLLSSLLIFARAATNLTGHSFNTDTGEFEERFKKHGRYIAYMLMSYVVAIFGFGGIVTSLVMYLLKSYG